MGNRFSNALSALGGIVTPRTYGSERRLSSTVREHTCSFLSGPGDGLECSQFINSCDDDKNDRVRIDSPSARWHVHTKNANTEKQGDVCTHLHSCRLEKVLTERSDALSQLVEAEKKLAATQAERCQLMTKCQKLEAQLALVERKTAQETLTSGSYVDDHANPGMLEVACKAVDKATESLAKFLHDSSIAKSCSLDSEFVENLVCQISSAHMAEFSRAIQVKYAWGHWICVKMFRCFEQVYFDLDENGVLTSPLDSKKHALSSFQEFQYLKCMSPLDLYEECHPFQAFCRKKHASMFPRWLVELAFDPKSSGDVGFGDFLQFNIGNVEIWNRFFEVAKAVWLLHRLAFSFNPPASILRMARGTPYEMQFHDSVIPDEGSDEVSQMVVLMIRPAFRLRNSIIRSRVFVWKKP